MRVSRRVCAVAVVATVGQLLTVVAGVQVAGAAEPAPPAPVPMVRIDERRDAATDVSDPAWSNPSVTLPEGGTYEVDVPASGWARAGASPVSVSRPAAGTAAARVRVRVLSQAEVAAAGGRLLGFEVTRADGGSAVGAVAVALDYSGIRRAYGGNFASSLKLVRSTSCAPGCAPAFVGAKNDATAFSVRATSVPVRPDPGATSLTGENTGTAPQPDSGFGPQIGDPDVLALAAPLTAGTTYTAQAAASGPDGDYTASPLSAADDWSVGIGSGALTYTYPIGVPPAVAGPAPVLSLDYSSQAVDGRTTSANGQVSQVGEGWGFEPGFIERKFHSCRDENLGRDDLCWSADNEYVLHFMGQSGEIVRTSAGSDEWRLRSDPAWRIRSYNSGGGNGDNDGEYFVVITPDGTKYWFGYGTEPRNTPTRYTNSAWEVPVYAGAGEPCYNAVPAASYCRQAYRWNVDRILDTNDNVTSYFYAKEYNNYARYGNTALPTQYVRSGYLTDVEYGQRNLAENATAYARVHVSTSDRCNDPKPCPAATAANAARYPDVPLYLMCTSATSCTTEQMAPTFWSTKEIDSIATEYWDASASPAAYDPVTTYLMTYSFPSTADSSTPSLWLKDITKRGEFGVGNAPLPGVRMSGIALANRVNYDSSSGISALRKYRVASISTDLGARLDVTYGLPDPCPQAPSAPAWDTNPYDCFPALYEGVWIPFHKYLVTDLVTVDARGGQPDQNVHYTYTGNPAWHYADSKLATSQSWSDYRGYQDVRVTVDGDSVSDGTDTRYVLFRGMQGDKLASGAGKNVPDLTDSLGASWNDWDYRAGQTLEVKSYDASGARFASTAYRYWSQQTVDGPDGFQSHDADYVRPSRVVETVKNLDTGAWRNHIVDLTYSTTTAAVLSTSDDSDTTCVKLGYANTISTEAASTSGGTTEWIVDAPYRSITYGDVCGSGTTLLVGQTEYDYDNQAFQTAPVDANVTQTRAFVNATTTAVTKTAYDSLGRVTSVISPNEVANGTNGATTTTYSPSTGYPYNGVTTTTQPATTATGATRLTTTMVPYPAFGTPRRIVDANDDTTSIFVDPLGRTTSVSRPGEPTGSQSLEFEYHIATGNPNRVETRRLIAPGQVVATSDYFDGLGRKVQSSLPGADGDIDKSRVVITRYDSAGRKARESAPFALAVAPGAGLVAPTGPQVTYETRYSYDYANRMVSATAYAEGVTTGITHRTTYHGWMHTVDEPVHSDVDYYTDRSGRTTQIVERPGTGTITTSYDYTQLGDLETITDDAGNLTSYSYDWLRHRTSSTDPDQGTWSTTYDREGNVLTVTDGITDPVTHVHTDKVTYAYDRLGRKTDVYGGAVSSANLLAHWTYDKAPDGTAVLNGLGRVSAATRYSGGAAYTTAVTGYDNRGRMTGKRWDIPAIAATSGVSGSYAYSYGYNLADEQVSVTLPAVGGTGGLVAETVTTVVNGADLPTSLTTSLDAAHPYVSSTDYDDLGRVLSRSLAGDVQRVYTYEHSLGRLQTSTATAEITGLAGAQTIEERTYVYDDDSNVTGIRDVVAGAAGAPQRECFSYDALNRLKTAFTTDVACNDPAAAPTTTGADPYNLAYAYDKLGDITSVTSGSTVTSYVYAGSGHVHAPASVGGSAYAYDGNGATTSRPAATGAQTLSWNKLHQLDSVSGTGASSFVYDADGNRLLRTSGTTRTLYLDGMELTSVNGATAVPTRYYGSVAMRTPAGVTTLLRNRQDSTSTAYDTVAKTAAQQRYTPFGARRGATPLAATERRFLDKTEDPTGLSAMGARYYDPTIGRFLSVDPLADLAHPQTLAGYSYAVNNPATSYDPSGLAAIKGDAGGSDRECVAARDCSKKYDRELRTRTLSRSIYELGGCGCLRSDSEILIETGHAGVLTPTDLATASIQSGFRREMLEALRTVGAIMYGALAIATLASALSVVFVAELAPAAVGAASAAGANEANSLSEAAAEAAPAADHIVLGLKSYGLDQVAAKVGGRTLMGDDDWQQTLVTAVNDLSTKFTVSLDGFSGGSTYSQVMGAVQRGSSIMPAATEWEMAQLYGGGRLPDVTFVRGGVEVANPFR